MLKPIPFGLALGIIWGAVLGLCMVGTLTIGYPGEALYPMFAAIYPGVDVSWIGAGLLTIFAFLDGLIGGAVFAWLYNKLAKLK